MKTHTIILLALMSIIISITSCKKNEEPSACLHDKEAITNSFTGNEDKNMRGNNPSIISYLNGLYGDLFDINNDDGIQNQYSDGNSTTVNIWAFPFKYMAVVPSYLTVVYTNSSNIIGLYIINFFVRKSDTSELATYVYSVKDPDGLIYEDFFSGYAVVYTSSYPPHVDMLTVYGNSIDIPSTYPYPIFDNVAGGNITLLSLDDNSVGNAYSTIYNEQQKAIIRIAATFYDNFCGSLTK